MIENIEKTKGNIPGFNKLLQILDRMAKRFEKETDKVVTNEFGNQAAGGNLIINNKEIKPE